MEREKECILVVGHQAVLRAVLGYFLATPLEVRAGGCVLAAGGVYKQQCTCSRGRKREYICYVAKYQALVCAVLTNRQWQPRWMSPATPRSSRSLANRVVRVHNATAADGKYTHSTLRCMFSTILLCITCCPPPPRQSIPNLVVPLHTLVELRPRPDGTMEFEYFPMQVGGGRGE